MRKKIQTHILKIKKWNQDFENKTILNNIKKINESENLEQSNNDISKIPTLS